FCISSRPLFFAFFISFFSVSAVPPYLHSFPTRRSSDLFYDDTPYRVPLDLEPMTKNVDTDFFEVNTYTNEVIGTATGVASGETVTQPWTGLEADSSYFWYVTATNEAEETAVSNMFSFQTEEVAEDIDIAHIRALV